MSYDVHFDQRLTLGTIEMSTPAWEVLNLPVLMSGPTVRGENRRIPGGVGVRALRHRPDESTRTLEVVVNGNLNPNGDPHEDPQQGVWDNWVILRSAFYELLTTDGNSTVQATATFRGNTISGLVQIIGFEVGSSLNPETIMTTLDVTIVSGMLL